MGATAARQGRSCFQGEDGRISGVTPAVSSPLSLIVCPEVHQWCVRSTTGCFVEVRCSLLWLSWSQTTWNNADSQHYGETKLFFCCPLSLLWRTFHHSFQFPVWWQIGTLEKRVRIPAQPWKLMGVCVDVVKPLLIYLTYFESPLRVASWHRTHTALADRPVHIRNV